MYSTSPHEEAATPIEFMQHYGLYCNSDVDMYGWLRERCKRDRPSMPAMKLSSSRPFPSANYTHQSTERKKQK